MGKGRKEKVKSEGTSEADDDDEGGPPMIYCQDANLTLYISK